MAEMTVTLRWNDELGEAWMNPDNLRLLLYGQSYTKPELLDFEVIKQEGVSGSLSDNVTESLKYPYD